MYMESIVNDYPEKDAVYIEIQVLVNNNYSKK